MKYFLCEYKEEDRGEIKPFNCTKSDKTSESRHNSNCLVNLIQIISKL